MNTSIRRWIPWVAACFAVLLAGCGLPAIDIPEGKPRARLETVERTAKLETVERTAAAPAVVAGDQRLPQAKNGVDSTPPTLPSNKDVGSFPPDRPTTGVPRRDPPPRVTPPPLPPVESTPPRDPSGSTLRIHLSVGTALPQSLPSGTAMFFSVDYEIQQGRPSTSERYYFVVTPARAKPIIREVKLPKRRGQLVSIVEKMMPTVGPFRAHLEAAISGGSRREITRQIMLKTVGGF